MLAGYGSGRRWLCGIMKAHGKGELSSMIGREGGFKCGGGGVIWLDW